MKQKNRKVRGKQYNKFFIKRLRFAVRQVYIKRHRKNPEVIEYLNNLSKVDDNPYIKQLRNDIINDFRLSKRDTSVIPGARWLRDVLLGEPRTTKRDVTPMRILVSYCEKNLRWGWILRIRKLGFLIASLVGLALIVIIIPKIFPGDSGLQIIDSNKPFYVNCYFSSDTTKHKVMILPFKFIDGDRWKEDKGFILKQRLDSLSIADSLNLEVKFCREIQPTYYGEDYYTDLKKQYKADHIIYGFLDDENPCEEDKVCLNFIADFEWSRGILNNSKTSLNYASDFKAVDNMSFAKGRLQEDMDYLLYFNAMMGTYQKENYYKVLEYSDKLLNKKSNASGIMHRARAVSFFKLFKDDLAMVESYKSLEYQSTHPAPNLLLGSLFSCYGKDKYAKYYLQKAIDLETSTDDQLRTLFGINSRLEMHTDNVILMTAFIKSRPEKSHIYRAWRSYSYKKLGRFDEAVRDSIYSKEYIDKNSNSFVVTNPDMFLTFERMFAQMRLQWMANSHDFYGRKKNADSIEKDRCRILTFDHDNLIEKSFEIPESCQSLWPTIFSYDEYFEQ